MKVGTRSILFGAHQFLIHPFFVAWGWIRLYGFPFDPRIWIAFFVHDLGYFGKSSMEGDEGERHVRFGARVMSVFGKKWKEFSLYHSRYFSKRDGAKPSRLCFADKMAIVLFPHWIYLPLAKLSGELYEYLERCQHCHDEGGCKYTSKDVDYNTDPKQWYLDVQRYVRDWIKEHKDGRDDTWTQNKD